MSLNSHPLLAIGWPDDAASQAALAQARIACPNGRLARVVAQHRSGYDVALDAETRARVNAPSTWLRSSFPSEQRAAVGDFVLLAADAAQIVSVLPRRSLLSRAAAGEHYQRQVIAANIDTVLVVCGLDGDFNPRRLERYCLLVQGSGARPAIVLTKADTGADVTAALAALAGLSAGGVPVHAVNAKDPATAQVLAPYLGPGRTLVLVGSSGAGKSTLTNTLLGRDTMKTGAVRGNDSRGRHTTTHRALLPLPQGGCLIDTPGMREIKLTGEEDIADGGFEDIEAIAGHCRFRDCEHNAEPGCAVRAAIDAGTLDPGYLASYRKLHGELADAAGQLALRLAQRADARVQNKALRKRLIDKYGRDR